MRGFLSGIVVGGVVSVLGLATASLLGEQPAGNAPPQNPQLEGPAGVARPQAEPDAGTVPPAGSAGGVMSESPVMTPPPVAESVPDAPGTAPAAEMTPPAEPDVGAVEGALSTPALPGAIEIATEPDNPILPNPQAPSPDLPVAESDIVLSTTPAAPPVMVVEEPEAGAETAPGATDQADAAVPPAAEDAAAAAMPDAGEAAEPDSAGGDAPSLVQIVPETGAESTQAPSAPARVTLQGDDNSLLGERETGVTIRRPGEDSEAAPEEEEAEQAAPRPALQAYGARAGDTGGLPMLAVVLVDDGSLPGAEAALAALPFPVTVALDPARDGAAEAMEAYRARGIEVMAMARVPDGAVPADVEVAFGAAFATLPETIGLLDLGDGGLQSDRAVTEQAMAILAGQGRGFVTISQGLNMAVRAAEQAGVPEAMVYREIDAEDQDSGAVRRFIDQAAFRARQESGVVLVGRVRPDTISALSLWATANRAGQVALVPVSAVLLAE